MNVVLNQKTLKGHFLLLGAVVAGFGELKYSKIA